MPTNLFLHFLLHFKRLGATMALSAVTLMASSASAGSNPAAEALFQEGKKAMDKGDYDTACRQFAESDRLEAAAGTKMNQANCEEKRGHVATAWALYKSVLGGMASDDQRYAFVKGKVDKLEPRVPKLTLVPTGGTPPADLVVTVAGQKFTATSFNVPLPVDPGSHTVTVSASGFQPQQAQLELAEGEQRAFRFAVAAPANPAPAAAPAAAAPAQAEPAPPAAPSNEPVESDSGQKSGSKGLRTLGFVLGGVGIAGLAAGGVLGAMVIKHKQTADDNCWEPTDEYPEGGCYPEGAEANRQGKQLAPLTTVALAAGSAALVGGIVLILANPSSDSSAASHGQSMATLQATPSSAKLTWTTTF
jgi:hypothetical protein